MLSNNTSKYLFQSKTKNKNKWQFPFFKSNIFNWITIKTYILILNKNGIINGRTQHLEKRKVFFRHGTQQNQHPLTLLRMKPLHYHYYDYYTISKKHVLGTFTPILEGLGRTLQLQNQFAMRSLILPIHILFFCVVSFI